MTKTIEQLQAFLRVQEAIILLVEHVLIELLHALQELHERFGGVQVDRPFTVAGHELMHRFTSVNLPLARA